MKLTVFSMASAEADAKDRGRSVAKPSFQTCHALLQHQPRSVAARLARLVGRAESAIRRGAPDRFARARQLEEAVCFVAMLRPSHADSQALKLCVIRLLRESFDSIDWRRPLIDGFSQVEDAG
jgi:hypothetical protein